MNGIDVTNALNATQELSQRKLNYSLAMAVRRLFRELSPIKDDIDTEHKKLIEQYAKKDKEGKYVTTKKVMEDGEEKEVFVFTDEQKFMSEYEKLLNAEVTVTSRIKAELFSEEEVEPAILILLGDCLEE